MNHGSSNDDHSVRGPRAQALLDGVMARLEARGVSLVYKSDSWLQRAIDRALRVLTFGAMNSYLSGYVTTIGRTIYLPDDWELTAPGRRWETLEHELVHVGQFERYGFVGMAVLYLLVPLPMGLAWFRARLEWEAYRVTIRCVAELEGIEAARDPSFREEIVRRFTGPDYGYMWPFARSVRRWIEGELATIQHSHAVH
jgi:hypothetical protein